MTALHADGTALVHIVGERHQVGHRTERLAQIVHVKTGNDDTLALVNQFADNVEDVLFEKLCLVDGHHFGVGFDQIADDAGILHRDGFACAIGVADYVGLAVAAVDGGLEDLDLASGNLHTIDTANEFLGLAREHRATDYFDAATLAQMDVF